MAENYAPCPKCGAADPKLLKFTWWGGALGPKMLTHVKCQGCGNKFNGKTGGDIAVGDVATYIVAIGLVSFILMFAVFFFLRFLDH